MSPVAILQPVRRPPRRPEGDAFPAGDASSAETIYQTGIYAGTDPVERATRRDQMLRPT